MHNLVLNKWSDDLPDIYELVITLAQDVFRLTAGGMNVEVQKLATGTSGNSYGALRVRYSDTLIYHIKLVRCTDSDSEVISGICERYPSLFCDTSVVIPRVFAITSSQSLSAKMYVHVTPWIESLGSLADIIMKMWMGGNSTEVVSLVQDFGAFLMKFHKRHPGINHNDMNPSNVLVMSLRTDSVPATFVLVDCAGLDDEVGDDFGSFVACLNVLGEGFEGEFTKSTVRAFEAGYLGN